MVDSSMIVYNVVLVVIIWHSIGIISRIVFLLVMRSNYLFLCVTNLWAALLLCGKWETLS